MKEISDNEYIARELAEVFKEEPYKAVLWLLVPNPMFGNITPAELVALRGPVGLAKIKKFIEVTKEENTPPEKK